MFIQLKDLKKVEITKDVCGHQGLSFIGKAYDNVLDKDVDIKMEVSNFSSCNAKIIKINKDITPKDSIGKFNAKTVKLRMDFDLTLPKNETGYYTITELDKTEKQDKNDVNDIILQSKVVWYNAISSTQEDSEKRLKNQIIKYINKDFDINNIDNYTNMNSNRNEVIYELLNSTVCFILKDYFRANNIECRFALFGDSFMFNNDNYSSIYSLNKYDGISVRNIKDDEYYTPKTIVHEIKINELTKTAMKKYFSKNDLSVTIKDLLGYFYDNINQYINDKFKILQEQYDGHKKIVISDFKLTDEDIIVEFGIATLNK